MELYLIRHGEYHVGTDDGTLTRAGVEQISRLADWLRGADARVDQIWSSPKQRARQSAEILQKAVFPAVSLIERPDLVPNAMVEAVRADLNAAQAEGILVVGHLPFIPSLAARLVSAEDGSSLFHLPTAGMLVLSRGQKGWSFKNRVESL